MSKDQNNSRAGSSSRLGGSGKPGEICGVILFPEDANQLRSVMTKLLFIRGLQILVGFITFACSLALNSRVSGGMGGTAPETVVYQLLDHTRGTTILLILTAFFVTFFSLMSAFAIRSIRSPAGEKSSLTLLLVRLGFLIDGSLITLTLSAFAAGLGSPMQMTSFGNYVADGDSPSLGSGIAGAALGLTCTLWVSFIYAFVLSFVVWTHLHLLQQTSNSAMV